MKVENFDKKYLTDVVELWNEAVAKETFYKPFTNEIFTKKFLENKFFENEGFKLLFDGDKLVGFGHGIVNDNDAHPGFITCVVVREGYRRQGLGSKILSLLEEYILGKGKKLIRLFFLNPINLEWFVPGTKADHPNAAGIAYNTPFYFLLLANGYNTRTQEDTYYVDITTYEIPEKVLQREKENAKDGYNITLYDPEKHHGFKELFIDGLNNPGWYQTVKANLAMENPDPMLIAEKDGEIVGWTGPMHNEPSGRGYFAGIGVHPKTQGRGLGKSLFCHLCDESRKNGAKFMTLFTGSTNPARNIYLSAGFKVIQSFATMYKEFK